MKPCATGKIIPSILVSQVKYTTTVFILLVWASPEGFYIEPKKKKKMQSLKCPDLLLPESGDNYTDSCFKMCNLQ